jgi:hypothetical protein
MKKFKQELTGRLGTTLDKEFDLDMKNDLNEKIIHL